MRKISKCFFSVGILLILCGLGILVFVRLSTAHAQREAEAIVARIQAQLPPPTGGVPDTYSSMQMPAREVDGVDVIGILEIPAWDVALPIGDVWESKTRASFPRRFSGTVYDNSLIVGGYDQQGQFDCLKRLDVGTVVTVTDMTGARFSYEVTSIVRKDTADAAVLTDLQTDLTLFMREAYSMNYILVHCQHSAKK